MSRELVPRQPCCEAVRPRRFSELHGAYEGAWREWDEAGEESAWDPATADGLP